MTVVVNHETGEVSETIGKSEARRLTVEAKNEFQSAADHHERGWRLIEEAVTGGGHIDLGYNSPGHYLHAEFDGVLAGLDVATRRLAIRSMTDLGLSSRAIAPVVGISDRMVRKDQSAGGNSVPTSQTPAASAGQVGSDEDGGTSERQSDDAESAVQPEGEAASGRAAADGAATVSSQSGTPAPRPPVIGIDGKRYNPPTHKPKPEPVAAEFTDHDKAEDLARNLSRNLSLLYALTNPERRAEYIATWADGTHDIRPLGADFITPDHMRALADALHDFASEWETAHV